MLCGYEGFLVDNYLTLLAMYDHQALCKSIGFKSEEF
jgi:hypothetical protein